MSGRDPLARRFIEERAGDPAAVDTRIGRLLAELPAAVPLPPARLRAVEARLAGAPGQRRWARLRWAVLTLVLAGGGAALAAVTLSRRGDRMDVPAPAPMIPTPPSAQATPVHEPAPQALAAESGPRPRRTATVRTTPVGKHRNRDEAARREAGLLRAEGAAAPAVDPAQPAALRPSWGPGPAHGGHAPGVVVPAGPDRPRSALTEEAGLVRQALVHLRAADAALALAVLDEHARRFARGPLRADAAQVRVDALVALGRRAEALRELDRLASDATVGPRGLELRVLRAELRARDDCRGAIADFDHVLARAGAAGAPLLERALRGRARCRLSLGTPAERRLGEQDLRAYLARFPFGRFAGEVQAELARLRAGASGDPP